jgi:hypothetical protein
MLAGGRWATQGAWLYGAAVAQSGADRGRGTRRAAGARVLVGVRG